MGTLAESLVSATSRPLKLRMRPDLTTRNHRYQGQAFWIVKEPIGLNYFRFHEEEFEVLKMLDGRTSLDAIKERFERRFAPQKITFADLQHFVGMLHRNGLVISEASGQGKQLKKRRDEKTWKEWMSKLANVLALRFRGIDPDRLLTWLHQYTGWFFTWPMVVFNMLFGLSALMLVLINYDTFQAKLPTFHQFFQLKNWIFLAAVMGIVKVLHEFGHGLSCKHFGGECHEMGAMLLVFTPALYCNVSDSWMLPNKWHRAAIGAAGMYVELFIASCATWLWWFSTPGLFNFLCLSVIFICSVSTVVFNGNPLLRYDGYYILMDLAEIPNLRQKSTEVLKRWLSETCLGIEQPESPFLPKENQFFFGLYTVAAEAYRLFVTFSILLFLNRVFEPYGLKRVGQMLAIAGLVGMVAPMVWQVWKFFRTPGRSGKVKTYRVVATVAVVAVVLAAIALIPLPFSVGCTYEVVPRDPAIVYASSPGKLNGRPLVKPLDMVEKGKVLATLSNAELVLQQTQLETSHAASQSRLEAMLNVPDPPDWLDAQLKSAQAIEQAARELLDRKRDEVEKLTITAPRAGIVLPPPRKKFPKQDVTLPSWEGTVFDGKNEDAYLRRNDVVCLIGDPTQLEAVLVVDQSDVDLVKEGCSAALMCESYVDRVFQGQVVEIAKIPLSEPPANLSSTAGGDVDTRVDKTGRTRTISVVYQARVPLKDLTTEDQHMVYLGQRGQARLYTGWQSLGQRLLRFVWRTFHFSL